MVDRSTSRRHRAERTSAGRRVMAGLGGEGEVSYCHHEIGKLTLLEAYVTTT